jgi:hypothetical protein
MKVYTVHEPARVGMIDRVDRAERFEFIADGFDWNAAVFAPFVLLGQRVWIGLAIYAATVVALVALLSALGADAGWIVLAIAAVHVVVGYEFGELRRAQLDADGWSDLGVVSGRTRDECERRFFAVWLNGQPLLTVPSAAEPVVRTGMQPTEAPTVGSSPSPAATAPTAVPGRWRGMLRRHRS